EPEVERRPQRVELPEAAAVLELDRRRIAEARREAMRLVTEHRCKPVPTAGVHTLRLGEGARELEEARAGPGGAPREERESTRDVRHERRLGVERLEGLRGRRAPHLAERFHDGAPL